MKKVGYAAGRRVVLKNPFPSVRIPLLERLFPRARYIHIRRDPLAVVPSTQRLWAIMGSGQSLGPWPGPPRVEEIIEVYRSMLARLEADTAALPAERCAEVRFEQLEADPVSTLRSLYARLGLTFGDTHQARVRDFLLAVRGYRKNSYPLDPGTEALIRERLGGGAGCERSGVRAAAGGRPACG